MQTSPDLQLIALSNAGSTTDHKAPAAQRKTILTVNAASCRWPIGDPRAAGFYLCGASVKGKSPYCERHAQVAVRGPSSPPIKWKVA